MPTTRAVMAREKWLRVLPDRVRIVELPEVREGYDFTEYIGDGHTVEEFRQLVSRDPGVRAIQPGA